MYKNDVRYFTSQTPTLLSLSETKQCRQPKPNLAIAAQCQVLSTVVMKSWPIFRCSNKLITKIQFSGTINISSLPLKLPLCPLLVNGIFEIQKHATISIIVRQPPTTTSSLSLLLQMISLSFGSHHWFPIEKFWNCVERFSLIFNLRCEQGRSRRRLKLTRNFSRPSHISAVISSWLLGCGTPRWFQIPRKPRTTIYVADTAHLQ